MCLQRRLSVPSRLLAHIALPLPALLKLALQSDEPKQGAEGPYGPSVPCVARRLQARRRSGRTATAARDIWPGTGQIGEQHSCCGLSGPLATGSLLPHFSTGSPPAGVLAHLARGQVCSKANTWGGRTHVGRGQTGPST